MRAERGVVEVERSGVTATVSLCSVGLRNALSVAMWQSLARLFGEFADDTGCRCIVVQGRNGDFSAGADISEFNTERDTLAHVRHYHEQVIAPALAAIATVPQVTIARIQGHCVGGGLEVATQCDLRVAASDARFGVPIARLGFPMAPDEMKGLLELVGRAAALELLLEGSFWDADTALRHRLVTRVVAPEALDDAVEAMVENVLRGAPQAARINKWLSRRLQQSREPLSDAERAAAFAYSDTADHAEGVRAFVAHRTPKFEDR